MTRPFSVELNTVLYFLCYIPSIVLIKLVTTNGNAALGRPLTGLETLPASLVISLVLTYAFIWASGWHRDAHASTLLGCRIPRPTWATVISGCGTALILFTVPLSLTFRGVSIPFIQLLMRGDILIIAPLVDVMFGRRVRWWSWVALVLVAIALAIIVRQHGGFGLPPLAVVTVILYTLGYFVRLAVMTRVAKTGEPAAVRRYFVEEKIVALPLAIVALAAITFASGSQAGELRWGFVAVWHDPVIVWLAVIGVVLTVLSILSAVILLDARENSYCVPLERSAGLVAGFAAAYLLAALWGQKAPTAAEAIGVAILVGTIVLLSVAPRLRPALR